MAIKLYLDNMKVPMTRNKNTTAWINIFSSSSSIYVSWNVLKGYMIIWNYISVSRKHVYFTGTCTDTCTHFYKCINNEIFVYNCNIPHV